MMNSHLFNALLAMDVYNRGPNAGVNINGSYMGSANISAIATNPATGFVAIAYDWEGNTVISYRGTDNLKILESGNDITNGWITGAGILNGQALDAVQFYERVSGQTIFEGRASNVLLTGHSLGGGLAGFISALTGTAAYVFDNSPYAAVATVLAMLHNQLLGLTTPNFYGVPIFGDYIFPSAKNIYSTSVAGEVLEYARALSSSAAGVGGLIDHPELAPLLPAAAALLPMQETKLGRLQPGGGNLGWVELHSQALLVTLLYDKYENSVHSWKAVADEVMNSWFNKKIGEKIGLKKEITGKVTEEDQMLRMIAYSALDGGDGLVFGDTGIRAMFDDLNLIGQLKSEGKTLGGLTQELVDIATQFGGVLAYKQIARAENAGATDGVISLQNNGEIMYVDLANPLWGTESTKPTIVGRDNLVKTLLAGEDHTSPNVLAGMKHAFKVDNTSIIDSIKVNLSASSLNITLEDRPAGSSPSGVTLFVASDGADQIVGTDGRDMIYGSGGDDILDGGFDNDLLIGGDGDDRFLISIGDDSAIGGNGTDTLDLSNSSESVRSGFFYDQAISSGIFAWNQGSVFINSVEILKASSLDDSFSFQVEGHLSQFNGITIDGNGGFDGADFIVFQNGLNFNIQDGGADTYVTVVDTSGAEIHLKNMSYIFASSGDDVANISGSNSEFLIFNGGRGNDHISVNLENSSNSKSVDGGAGNDTLVTSGGYGLLNALTYNMSGGNDQIDCTSIGLHGSFSINMTGLTGGYLTVAQRRPVDGDADYSEEAGAWNGIGAIFATDWSLSDFKWELTNFDPANATDDGLFGAQLLLHVGNETIDFGLGFGHLDFQGGPPTVSFMYGLNPFGMQPYFSIVTQEGTFTLEDISPFSEPWTMPFPSVQQADDQTQGGNGDDNLPGTNGDDALRGGSGSDGYSHGLGDGNDTVTDQGNVGDLDVLSLGVGINPGEVTVSRSDDGYDFHLDFSDGSKVTLEGQGRGDGSGVESISFTSGAVWIASDLKSKIVTAETGTAKALIGFSDADILVGTTGSDKIEGRGGDDTITPLDGVDVIDGGSGNDLVVLAGMPTDYVYRRSSDATITVTELGGAASVYRISQVESIQFQGNGITYPIESLLGGYGTPNNDVGLQGTTNDDFLFGLAGDDVLTGYAGDDVIDGGVGSDEAVFSGLSTDYVFVRNRDGSVTVIDQAGSDGRDTLISIENVYFQGNSTGGLMETFAGQIGSSSNDEFLLGTATANSLYGFEGDDVLAGFGGDDLLDGGEGTDEAHLMGMSSDYTFKRTESGAVLVTDTTGSDGSDILLNMELVYFAGDHVGKSLADVVSDYGSSQNDLNLSGTLGDDTLFGLEGDDVLLGSAGSDLIDGGVGDDQLNYSGSISDYQFIRRVDGAVIANKSNGSVDILVGVESLYFEASGTWRALTQVVGDYGTDGNDPWLAGTSGADNLFGLSGDDTLYGGAGDDFVNGGQGYDQANFTGNFSSFSFSRNENGAISITDHVGNQGYDTLASVEALYFDGSDDWMSVSDVVADYGSNNDDPWLEGTETGDNVYGLSGDDTLVGRGGNDYLYGGDGYDQANYTGSSNQFTFALNNDGTVTVTDTFLNEGVDILSGVEALYFEGDDTWMTVEQALGQSMASGGVAPLVDDYIMPDQLYWISTNAAHSNDLILA